MIGMFTKGDMVVYPMYGAGVIEDLEDRFIDGRGQTYYVLRIPVGNLKIMISTEAAENAGIRGVLPSGELIRQIESVRERPVKQFDNWNQRYKENLEKIRSGSLSDAAEVFRNLRARERERERGLSAVEKKMLTNVKQILISEIILSYSVERNEAEEILERNIEKAV
jgi:CarD family transcriptional regulator